MRPGLNRKLHTINLLDPDFHGCCLPPGDPGRLTWLDSLQEEIQKDGNSLHTIAIRPPPKAHAPPNGPRPSKWPTPLQMAHAPPNGPRPSKWPTPLQMSSFWTRFHRVQNLCIVFFIRAIPPRPANMPVFCCQPPRAVQNHPTIHYPNEIKFLPRVQMSFAPFRI